MTRRVQNLQTDDAQLTQTSGAAESSLGNFCGARNVAPTPPLLEQLLTTASCCTWFSTGDTGSSQKALRNLATLIVVVLLATQSVRNDVVGAPSAKVTLYSQTFVLVISFRTVGSLDIRMHRPMACPPLSPPPSLRGGDLSTKSFFFHNLKIQI